LRAKAASSLLYGFVDGTSRGWSLQYDKKETAIGLATGACGSRTHIRTKLTGEKHSFFN